MDWTHAVERNLAILMRIADALCAMAGIGADAAPGSLRASFPASLPRHLHAAVLSILRPAESALRRLILIAARDLVIVLSPAEQDRIAQTALPAHTSRTGIFWNDRPASPENLACLSREPHMARDLASHAAPGIAMGGDSGGHAPCFALFDPLKRFAPVRQGPSQSIPRILFDLDLAAPVAPPQRPAASPEDPISAAQLCRRLTALKSALDDLPEQARRLARWRARRRWRARGRLSPMRPGSPPGHRSHGIHPVDELLSRCHGLAIDVGARRDTS